MRFGCITKADTRLLVFVNSFNKNINKASYSNVLFNGRARTILLGNEEVLLLLDFELLLPRFFVYLLLVGFTATLFGFYKVGLIVGGLGGLNGLLYTSFPYKFLVRQSLRKKGFKHKLEWL